MNPAPPVTSHMRSAPVRLSGSRGIVASRAWPGFPTIARSDDPNGGGKRLGYEGLPKMGLSVRVVRLLAGAEVGHDLPLEIAHVDHLGQLRSQVLAQEPAGIAARDLRGGATDGIAGNNSRFLDCRAHRAELNLRNRQLQRKVGHRSCQRLDRLEWIRVDLHS